MSYKEDYAKTIFLYINRKAHKLRENDEYPRYLLYEFSITNPKIYHQTLIGEGYFRLATLGEKLDSLTLTDLKTICTSLGITKTGKKSDVIKRILSNSSDSQTESLINNDDDIYVLSDAGTTFLNDHYEYVKLHKNKNWDITIDEYIEAKRSFNKFEDAVWSIFTKKCLAYSQNYPLLRCTYYNMATFLHGNRHNEQALNFFLKTLLIDVSGVENFESLQFLNTKQEMLDYYLSSMFAPGLLEQIIKLQPYYTEEMIDKIFSELSYLPLNVCSKENFKELIQDLFLKPSFDEGKYQKLFIDNYERFIDNAHASKPNTNAPTNIHKQNTGCLSVLCCWIGILFLVIFL